MLDQQLLAFLGVAVLVTVTPGPDMALVTRHALLGGRRPAMRTVLGVMTGIAAWGMLSAVGLAALLNASAAAFAVLKLAGGAYLVYLGAQAIWQSRGRHAADAGPEPHPAGDDRETEARAFRQGLLSNLLNPKVGIFYSSLLPQFVTPEDPALAKSAALALLHFLIGLAWLVCYVQIMVKAGAVLRRPTVRRWLDRATGAVLVALGLRLAIARR